MLTFVQPVVGGSQGPRFSDVGLTQRFNGTTKPVSAAACWRAEADRKIAAYQPATGERRGPSGTYRPRGAAWKTLPVSYEQCGQEFRRYTLPDGSRQPQFCSMSCSCASRKIYDDPRSPRKAATRRRRLRHAETWDGIEDRQIYERDGWICQIPGCTLGPIPADLPYPGPLSPSIDHILPVSLGGPDIALNKRAAHLDCNTRRGNRVGSEAIPSDLSDYILEPRRRERKPKLLPGRSAHTAGPAAGAVLRC